MHVWTAVGFAAVVLLAAGVVAMGLKLKSLEERTRKAFANQVAINRTTNARLVLKTFYALDGEDRDDKKERLAFVKNLAAKFDLGISSELSYRDFATALEKAADVLTLERLSAIRHFHDDAFGTFCTEAMFEGRLSLDVAATVAVSRRQGNPAVSTAVRDLIQAALV